MFKLSYKVMAQLQTHKDIAFHLTERRGEEILIGEAAKKPVPSMADRDQKLR